MLIEIVGWIWRAASVNLRSLVIFNIKKEIRSLVSWEKSRYRVGGASGL